ncbi:hypothetical protein [Caulobacter mirabilis]|uniref:Uncharacterized protein n=1 Tax=Caulobacter mirabilis TaxID=69666 RepID=A0A2D2AUV5_9CAUL|nr:hypothetical protein [Caulobacter mirabilis]ATQ41743.1 hypothetical protein CSW64_04625 [Caulobacter mirabilis]
MSGNQSPSLYLKLRRSVDRDLSRQGRPMSPYWGLAPLGLLAFGHPFLGAMEIPAWCLAGAVAVAWAGFIAWRGLRLAKAHALKRDRDFDRRGKFGLAPVYWGSESAARAGSRRRGEKRRGQA